MRIFLSVIHAYITIDLTFGENNLSGPYIDEMSITIQLWDCVKIVLERPIPITETTTTTQVNSKGLVQI